MSSRFLVSVALVGLLNAHCSSSDDIVHAKSGSGAAGATTNAGSGSFDAGAGGLTAAGGTPDSGGAAESGAVNDAGGSAGEFNAAQPAGARSVPPAQAGAGGADR